MQLDQLQLDLRPRPNAQALDLGFALLRAHAGTIYTTWLLLCLPFIAICGALAYFLPHFGFFGGTWWLLVVWWFRPLLERAPLYILSREVFGEHVTWQQALRAWPSQCGGGLFRLLFWWRPFSAGRGLYQPIWQLEGARGKVAGERMRVIGKRTLSSATWFGVACAHFEGLLQLGLFFFLGQFLNESGGGNPLAFIVDQDLQRNTPLLSTLAFVAYAFAISIIGPIYVACTFTLYLNRRASLEAWDIEIMLRQLKPVTAQKHVKGKMAAVVLMLFLSTVFFPPPEATAGPIGAAPPVNVMAGSAPDESCPPPKNLKLRPNERAAVQSPEQQQVRDTVDAIYRDTDLRPYICVETWVRQDPEKPKKSKHPNLAVFAQILKVLAIALLVGFLAWLLYRYRGQFFGFSRTHKPRFATEVGGLDIRPESLPDDVSASALALWNGGQQRAAIALLYRATLSRLVDENQLAITKGATENDCLRIAQSAQEMGGLSQARYSLADDCTEIWLRAAYAHRFPESIEDICNAWQREFDLQQSAMNVKGQVKGQST